GNIAETLDESTLLHAPDGSDVEVGHESSVFLNEIKPRLGLVAHQPIDSNPGTVAVLDDLHLQQRAGLGVHGGFAQMRMRHLAEALEAGDVGLALAVELGREQP